jgi:hypothetical protein
LHIWIQHDENIKPRKFSAILEQNLGHQKVKKHQKMTSLPLFGHTEAVLGDSLLRGKMTSKSKIQDVPETRQEDLSNELSWAQFG